MTTILDWSAAVQRAPGETESGDLHLVKQIPNGMLVAGIDGIGHGAQAAAAARAAAVILEAYAQESVTFLIEQCHKALIGTRGAAMSLASFNLLNQTMAWLGVGNVEGVLFYNHSGTGQAKKSLLSRAGIVGCHLPQLNESICPVSSGDTLILASDGIHYAFADHIAWHLSPGQMARDILSRHSKGTDDAMVLVARYQGGQP